MQEDQIVSNWTKVKHLTLCLKESSILLPHVYFGEHLDSHDSNQTTYIEPFHDGLGQHNRLLCIIGGNKSKSHAGSWFSFEGVNFKVNTLHGLSKSRVIKSPEQHQTRSLVLLEGLLCEQPAKVVVMGIHL